MPGLQNLLSRFFESIDFGVMVIDVDGIIQAVNHEACKLLGYTEDELCTRDFTFVLMPEQRAQAFEWYIQNFTRAKEEKLSSTWEIKRKDGEVYSAEAKQYSFLSDEGEEYQALILKKKKEVVPAVIFSNIQNAVLENLKESVVVVRIDGTILYWNQGATNIYEYQEEEVVGRLIYKFWPEETFIQFVRYFALGNDKLDLFDSLHIRKNGKKIYVDFRITPLNDEGGNLIGLIFISQDVTNKYKTKKAIREQRNMLASLIDSQSNFLIRLDPSGKVVFGNKAFQQHFHFISNIEGAYFSDFFSPGDQSTLLKILEQLSQKAELQKAELKIVNAKKEKIWTSWEIVSLLDKAGRISGIQAVGIDISERKKVEEERDQILDEVQMLNKDLQANEEELRQNLDRTLELKNYIERSEKKWKSLLENSFEAVLVFNEAGYIQYASPSVLNILGFSPEEMVGEKAMMYVHKDDLPTTRMLMQEVMAKPGEPVYVVHKARKKSGEYISIESYCTNLLADENVNGIVSNYRDITARKEAEAKLRNSEASLNLAQHIAKFGSVEFDLLSGQVKQSSGLFAIYDFDLDKYAESEFNGFEYIHPEDVEKVRSFFISDKEFGPAWITDVRNLPEKRRQQLENYPFEYRIISATGKLKHIKSISRTIKDEGGRPIKNVVTIQDVTEGKHLERMLEDTSEMAKIGGWELNLETKKYFGTPHMLRMLKLPPGTMIPLGEEMALFHPDFRPQIEHAIQDLIAEAVPFDLDLIMLNSEKEDFWARIIGRAEKVNGTVVGVKGFIKDITDRKNAEKEIERYGNRLRIATEAAGIGVWDWDLRTKEMVWDAQMKKIYGFAADEPVNFEMWKKIVHPEDLTTLDTNFPEVLKEGNSESEYRIILPSGKIKWIKAFSKAFKDPTGNPKRLVGVNWDISRLKQTEEVILKRNDELLKINNELDHFVYSTSHNLRAPLTSILGIVELIKYFPDPDEFKLYVSLIEKSVKKLDETIQEITNYSKNARVEVAAEAVNFEILVQEMVESLSFLENAEKIKINYSIPQGPPFYSDLSRIKMVFTNLLSNAIKYADFTKDHPFIEIHIKQSGNGAAISIRDNGIGIAREYQEKIFDMFFRASTMSTGSGLGLYIVKEAVQKLGGTVDIKSTPGEGTEFNVFLPNLGQKNNELH